MAVLGDDDFKQEIGRDPPSQIIDEKVREQFESALLSEVMENIVLTTFKAAGSSSPKGALAKFLLKKVKEAIMEPAVREGGQGQPGASKKPGPQEIAVRRAISTMENYYKLSALSFVSYVNALVVQNSLLQKLPYEIFTYEIVSEQDADTVSSIAGEKEHDTKKRTECEQKLAILTKAVACFEDFQQWNLHNIPDIRLLQLGRLAKRSITAFYRQIHSTTTEASATTHGSTTADSTISSTSSVTGDPESNTGTRGLSGGAIAGVVIGAIAGLCLIGCGFYIAYRMGRRSRNDPETPRRSFMDSLRAIPRPNVNITWTQPKDNARVPALQQTFTEDLAKGPGEMLGDTSQHNQQPNVPGGQHLPKSEVPVVELACERVDKAEAPTDDAVGARTDAQQQPYSVDRTTRRPSGI
ncbi:hypothetical protein CEP54_015578 [Fusarium duplospermum]|uniref:GED domain-containing protein n=1 Tax=Fusarium duplospermum TaxID=1325734 RepID=A0A428NN41_9HYPO|nr:hypothetical protein CEP54_015578 [Fusarium duplospermum]